MADAVLMDINVPQEVEQPPVRAIKVPKPKKLTKEEAEANEQARLELERIKAEVVQQIKDAISFDGTLQWVQCPLPGYETVRIAYNVDNDFEIAELLARSMVGLDVDDLFRLWSLFVRRIEGLPGDAPPLDLSNPESFRTLLYTFKRLMFWCIKEGYEQAKREVWGN